MENQTQLQKNSKAPQVWIVFSGQSDLPWLAWLKPGFRHCYALLHDGRHWITFDPMSHYTDISVHSVPGDFDLPRWLESRGLRLIKAPVTRLQKPAPWMLFTCVEAIKRLIGLHDRLILTPWQLYRHLENLSQDKNPYPQKGDLSWEV